MDVQRMYKGCTEDVHVCVCVCVCVCVYTEVISQHRDMLCVHNPTKI